MLYPNLVELVGRGLWKDEGGNGEGVNQDNFISKRIDNLINNIRI